MPSKVSSLPSLLPVNKNGAKAFNVFQSGVCRSHQPGWRYSTLWIFPTIVALGFDPIWFGVVMVIVLEMGLISPPVGVNVFVVKGIAEDVPMSQIFIGILPFWLAMGVCLAIIVAFPQIALVLPNTMIN